MQGIKMRVERIGEAVLYLGDCLEAMPLIDPIISSVDWIITDPPYGIGKDGQVKTTGGNGGRKAHEFMDWDSERPSRAVFDAMLKLCPSAPNV